MRSFLFVLFISLIIVSVPQIIEAEEKEVFAPTSFITEVSCTAAGGSERLYVVFALDTSSMIGTSIARVASLMVHISDTFIHYDSDFQTSFTTVTFADGCNIWDSNPGSSRLDWFNTCAMDPYISGLRIGGGGSDSVGTAWDAIWVAMDSINWRPHPPFYGIKVLVLITKSPSCALDKIHGSGCCCDDSSKVYADTLAHPYPAFANPYMRAIEEEFIVYTFTESPLTPSSSFWDGMYNRIADATGGYNSPISTMWSITEKDRLFNALYNVAIPADEVRACVTNSGPDETSVISATIYTGDSLKLLLGAKSQNHNEWPADSTYCFKWKVNNAFSGYGPQTCYSVVFSGALIDTLYGCLHNDPCECTPPKASIICPQGESDTFFYACRNRRITMRLEEPYDSSKIGFWLKIQQDTSSTTSVQMATYIDKLFKYPSQMSILSEILLTYTIPESMMVINTTTDDTFYISMDHNMIFKYDLHYIGDTADCYNIKPVIGSFITDFKNPEFIDIWPPKRAVLLDSMDIDIEMWFIDEPAGIDLSSIRITGNGTVIPEVFITKTFSHDTLSVKIFATKEELGAAGMDTLALCVEIADNVNSSSHGCNLCGPNDTTYCITFYIDPAAPHGSVVFPEEGIISSCRRQEFGWLAGPWASHTGYTYSVDGVKLTTGLIWRDDTVYYRPSSNWTEEIHNLCLHKLYGRDGRLIVWEPICGSFRIDLSDPTFSNHSPIDIVNNKTHPVSIRVLDNVKINWSTAHFTVEGDTYDISDISIVGGEQARLELSAVGHVLPDSGMVELCFYVEDSTFLCPPNSTNFCWEIEMHAAPMLVSRFSETGVVTSCSTFSPQWWLQREPVRNSIVIYINSMRYNWFTGRITWWDPILAFEADTDPWEHGDSIHACLDSARDVANNSLESIICIDFWIDREGPEVTDITPTGIIYNTSPIVSVNITDDLDFTNVVPESLKMYIKGCLSEELEVAAVWTDPLYSFDCASGGIVFADGETVTVRIYAIDNAQICRGNVTEFTWFFVVDDTTDLVTEGKTTDNQTAFEIHNIVGNQLIVDYSILDDAKITVFDILGRTLYSYDVSGKGTLPVDMSKHNSGLYFVSLSWDDQSIIKKVALIK